MEKFLIGLDFGTGGAKAALINTQGDVIAYAFEEYQIICSRPGWSEHNPTNYWVVACRLIGKVLADSGIPSERIMGIAASSAMPSMVMVDVGGNPIANAYNLMDRRASKQVQWLKENIGEDRIFEVSKNRLEDHPLMVNLMWEKEKRPDQFARIHKVLSIDGYINFKLTGQFTCHYSGAAFYGVAYDMLSRSFDQKLLEEIGIPESFFPKLFRSEEIIGQVTGQAAAETGLAQNTPVAAGQVDCNAGWMGAGMIAEGNIQMNLGTCGNFGILTKEKKFPNTMINFPYTVDSDNTFIIVPTTTTGGQLIRYMRDNFYSMEHATENVLQYDTFDIINKEAMNVPLGSDGLVVLPYLMGERTPLWDTNARGVIFGLSLNHTRGHVVKAMMESVAFALFDSFRIIRDSGTIITAPIVLNEGGAKSSLWRRIITDVFNIPTVLVKRRTGAPFGDAILAGVATGVFNDFSVAQQWAEYIDRMEPDQSNHEKYMQYFKLYKSVYENLKLNFQELAALRNQ